MRALVLVLAACPSLLAQAPPPAPAGETAEATWTPAEAHAFALVQRVAEQWRAGLDNPRSAAVSVPDYALVRISFAGDEAKRFDERFGSRVFEGGASLLYVVPRTVGTAARRMFCVRGDGVLAFTDNERGVAILGEDAFDGATTFARGGEDELGAFPRTPVRANNGDFWLPASMAPLRTANVMVVDEHGEPFAMETIRFEPAPQERVVAAPLPAGSGMTTFEGSMQVRGALARGLGVRFGRGRTAVWIAPECVTARGHAVRIEVRREVLMQRRFRANEAAAIATLKNISSAQAQCQASGVIDADGDGSGEYGMFGELSGRLAVRGGGKKVSPPVLSAAFGNVNDGTVIRSGYCFRVFLPDADGKPLAEQPAGGATGLAVDADGAEVAWCCYAWPTAAGASGQRAFFVNQAGDVFAAPNAPNACSGAANGPLPLAAFADGATMRDTPRDGGAGADGQTWKIVN